MTLRPFLLLLHVLPATETNRAEQPKEITCNYFVVVVVVFKLHGVSLIASGKRFHFIVEIAF